MSLVEHRNAAEPGVVDCTVWLTPAEAAERARLSRDNFLRRCRAGTGPTCSGKCRLMRFKSADVDRWIAGGFKNG